MSRARRRGVLIERIPSKRPTDDPTEPAEFNVSDDVPFLISRPAILTDPTLSGELRSNVTSLKLPLVGSVTEPLMEAACVLAVLMTCARIEPLTKSYAAALVFWMMTVAADCPVPPRLIVPTPVFPKIAVSFVNGNEGDQLLLLGQTNVPAPLVQVVVTAVAACAARCVPPLTAAATPSPAAIMQRLECLDSLERSLPRWRNPLAIAHPAGEKNKLTSPRAGDKSILHEPPARVAYERNIKC